MGIAVVGWGLTAARSRLERKVHQSASDAAVAAEEEDVGVSGREENGKVRRGLCGFGVGRRAGHPIQSLVVFF